MLPCQSSDDVRYLAAIKTVCELEVAAAGPWLFSLKGGQGCRIGLRCFSPIITSLLRGSVS